MSMINDKKEIQNYCSKCIGMTSHNVLFKANIGSEQGEEFGWDQDYMIVECCGCKRKSFREQYTDQEMLDYTDEGTAEQYYNIKIYPPAIKNHLALKDIHLLPHPIEITYKESITAFQSNCPLLAAAGFRAVVEAVCKDLGIKGRDIVTKIDNLNLKGFLSKYETDRLHAVRFLGNDSIHEMKVPENNQLLSALKIIEHLLDSVYLIDIQMSKHIETVITNYEEFESLLSKQIKLKKDNLPASLNDLLGKSIRRVSKDLNSFEKKLIINIRKGNFKKLSLDGIKKQNKGKKETDIQYYKLPPISV